MEISIPLSQQLTEQLYKINQQDIEVQKFNINSQDLISIHRYDNIILYLTLVENIISQAYGIYTKVNHILGKKQNLNSFEVNKSFRVYSIITVQSN